MNNIPCKFVLNKNNEVNRIQKYFPRNFIFHLINSGKNCNTHFRLRLRDKCCNVISFRCFFYFFMKKIFIAFCQIKSKNKECNRKNSQSITFIKSLVHKFIILPVSSTVDHIAQMI